MTAFAFDPVFISDFHHLGDLPLSRVLLNNDARYTWLTMVPRRAGIVEIIDLNDADRRQLFDEILIVSEVLKADANPDKLNVGALGNMVRQLHVHIIARFVSDPAWPGPVWGHSPAVPYPPHRLGIVADRLGAALKSRGMVDATA